MIWIIFALLTGVAIAAILWPLARARASSPLPPSAVDFYSSEIARVHLDLERGLLAPDTAKALEVEASRRLLREQGERDEAALSATSLKWSSLLALLFIPLITLPLYMALGHPDVPDMPLEARLNGPLNATDFAAAMARMEKHLMAQPDDAQALALIAPVYMRLSDFVKAAAAFRRLIALGRDDAASYMGLATSLLQVHQGTIDEETLKAYAAAFARDDHLYEAEFYVGMGQQQAGNVAQAAQTWIDLYQRSPAQAPWLAELADNIRNVGGNVPDRSDVAPSAQVNAPDVVAMVERLAQRLQTEPHDLNGWMQLIRSYKVLHEQNKMHAAVAQARVIFEADPAALQALNQLAQD